MFFNSLQFVFLFLPVAIIGFHLFRFWHQTIVAQEWLIVCSLLFYSWANPSDLTLLLASIAFNYAITRIGGATSESSVPDQRRKHLFVAGVVANILFLSYFKYFSKLPLGISFFTLMQVMYLVDWYEGVVRPNTFREHALFVAFFPTVSIGAAIAGEGHHAATPEF